MTGDWIDFAAETDAAAKAASDGWRIVVVDDDPEVHAATRLALRHVQVHGRPLRLVHLHSAAETRRELPRLEVPAVILLDVMMESADAGLLLVDFIRNECRLSSTRIVLRTGQPGSAPELGVFSRYDIDDYLTKSELTRTRLITAISSAVKSHEQIRTIEASRRGLELIVRSSPALLQPQALARFAEGVLTQATALLRGPIDGIVCAQRGSPQAPEDDRLYVVGAVGALAASAWRLLAEVHAENVVEDIARALRERRNLHGENFAVLYLSTFEHEAAVYVATQGALATTDRQLLEVFAANLAVCFRHQKHFEEVHRLAFSDPLTGLLNRAGLLRELDGMAGRSDLRLLLVDIDHFADFNDGLGQETGDLLLAAVGQRLRETFGSHASLGRVGADLFAVIGAAERLAAATVQSAFDAPFTCAGLPLPARATLGFCALGDCADGVTALRHASLALKRAKRTPGRPATAYAAALGEPGRQRLDTLARLRRDLDKERLEVWYQPQLRLADGHARAIEATLRWPDGRGGWMQPPAVFIPLAEHSGLIVPMGEFVLERACAALATMGTRAALERRDAAPARVAVNVALPQLRDPRFAAMVEQTLARHGLGGERLELEVSARIAMDAALPLRRVLEHLRSLHVGVALDDFGSGGSALARLRELPVDTLKIDRHFISGFADGPDEAFVECIVGLAARLGLGTVADGIETREQADCLLRLGCEHGQGEWLARSMPVEALHDWLLEHARA